MISKPSSHSFLRQQLKQYLWIAVMALYLCVSYILEFASAQKGIRILNGEERLGPQNGTMYYITVALALACAVQGFAMLFSDKKSSFYFGMPVSRRRLFFTNYTCGLLAGLFPCLLSRGICFFLRNDAVMDAGYLTVMGMVISSLGFLFLYHLTILVIVLTGKALGALAGIALAAVYGSVLVGFTIEKYCMAFLDTYYKSNIFERIQTYLSPLKLYEMLAGIKEYAPYEEWLLEDKMQTFLMMAVLVFCTLAAAWILFQKRGAESAGKTLAFDKIKSIIKLIVVIPVSLLTGYYAMQCDFLKQPLWFLGIGVLLGAFAGNGILEMLYQADARRMLAKKGHVAVISIVSFLIAGTFYFDVWGYDAYQPEKQELMSLAIGIRGIEDPVSMEKNMLEDDVTTNRLENMELKEKDMENALAWIGKVITEQKGTPLTYVTVGYHKSKSRIIYRRYKITSAEQLDAFASIYECDAYKEGTILLAHETEVGRQRFVWSNGLESYRLAYDEEEEKQLLESYHSDLRELKLSELKENNPIGALKLTDWSQSLEREGYIYPGFHRTIAFLKERGIPADKRLAEYDITRIDITEDYTPVTIEAAQIERLKKEIVFEEFAVNQAFIPVKSERVQVEYRFSANRTFGVAECRLKD